MDIGPVKGNRSSVSFQISALEDKERSWASRLLQDSWGSTIIVTRGAVYQAAALPGFVARIGDELLGLITFHLVDDQCEIVSLNSLAPNMGIGSALIAAVKDKAQEAGFHRLWLITTNDNMPALHFYQKRGFRLVAVHRDALDITRTLKPELSEIGLNGIPLRDEIELELLL